MGDSSVGDTQTLGFKDFIESLQAIDASSLFSKFDGILNSDGKSSFNLRLNSGKAAQGGPVSFTVRFFDKPKLAQIKQLIHDGKCSPTDAFKELNTLIEKGRIIFEYKDKAGGLHACSSEEVIKALKSGQHKLVKKTTNEVCEYQMGAPLKTEQFSELAHLVDSTLKLTETKKDEKKQSAEPKAVVEPKAAPPPQAAPAQAKAKADEQKREVKPQAKDAPQTNPKEVDSPAAEQTENVFDEIIGDEISAKESAKEAVKDAPQKASQEAPKAEPKIEQKEQAKPEEALKAAPKDAPQPKEAPAKEAAAKKEEKPAQVTAKEPEKSAPQPEKASSEKAKDVPPTSQKEVP